MHDLTLYMVISGSMLYIGYITYKLLMWWWCDTSDIYNEK